MEKKKLLELAKQLNGLADDDGNALASKKVKVVAVSDDKLKASFLDACESIPEEKEGLIPDEISDAYNEIIKEDPREELKEEAEEEKVEEKTKPTPKKRVETKEKETKKKSAEVSKKEEAKKEEKKQETKKKASESKEKTVTKKTLSNKLNIYRKWANNKLISIDKLNAIAPEIKLSTIKNWVNSWKNDKNLPSGI